MANISHLKNDKKNRRIREVLSASGQIVNIYEPTVEQVNEILAMQDRWINPESKDLQITGEDIVLLLFPMLTDIEGLDSLTKEEVSDIIENPSLLYSQVQYAIEIVITEIYKTLILANRKGLVEQDLDLAAQYSAQEVFDRVISLAAKKDGVEDLHGKVIQFQKDFVEKVEQKETEELNQLEKETGVSLSEARKALSKYEESFLERDGVKYDLGSEDAW